MKTIVHIPAIRAGTPYQSLDSVMLKDRRKEGSIAELSQVNGGLVRRDLLNARRQREALAETETEEYIEICARAAEIFLHSDLPTGAGANLQSPQLYVEQLSATTGLPHTLCRANMVKIYDALSSMRQILNGLTRSLYLGILDRGFGRQENLDLSFCPTTDSLGVILPSNSPGVNSLWLPAVALKIPVIIKPGREDPWTPYRIVQSLLAAGCPPEGLGFYPTGHEGSETILQSTGRAIVFGGDETARRFSDNPNIQVHGPGRSKILIGEDCCHRWPEFIDVLTESIAANSGRSCINASSILTPRYGDEIAAAISREFAEIQPRDPESEDSHLAGFSNPEAAEAIDTSITNAFSQDGAIDVTAGFRSSPRLVVHCGQTYLLPTVVRCATIDHPLANSEYLFPFASVVETAQANMLPSIGQTLIVTAITEDEDWIGELLRFPDIDRLNIGPIPTNQVRWDQPHEGNLFDFLYRRRALIRYQEK